MAKAVVKTLFHGSYLPTAGCLDPACLWLSRQEQTTREQAKAHTAETGHQTVVEMLTTSRYGREGA